MGLLLTLVTQHWLPASPCSLEPPRQCNPHVRDFFSPGGCFWCGFNPVCGGCCVHRPEERGGGSGSFPHVISGWPGQVGKEGSGLHPAQNLWGGYYNDDISFQRRPEECGGCNLGHIPTPTSVYLHSFSFNIHLSLMVAIKKKTAVSVLTHLWKPVSEILLQIISQILSWLVKLDSQDNSVFWKRCTCVSV